jgi:hypothetical protein
MAKRNSTETLNSTFKRTLPSGRAHSVGRVAQEADLLGSQLGLNALTLAPSPEAKDRDQGGQALRLPGAADQAPLEPPTRPTDSQAGLGSAVLATLRRGHLEVEGFQPRFPPVPPSALVAPEENLGPAGQGLCVVPVRNAGDPISERTFRAAVVYSRVTALPPASNGARGGTLVLESRSRP